MKKVADFKYPIPKLGRNESIYETFELIQRGLYGSDCEYMSHNEIKELITNLTKYAPKFTIQSFCIVYGYCDKIEFVELMAKYLGVGFNSIGYSVQEDTLIRAYYPIFGKFTNQIVADVMQHNLKVDDYVMKSERDIQDRVDYLQQGKNFFNTFKSIIPVNYKKLIGSNSTALVCVDIPKNRPSYSEAEKKMLVLTEMYGLNFLPWKDSKEVEYYTVANTQEKAVYIGKCCKQNFTISNLFPYFFSNCRAGLTILLSHKSMKNYNPNWNSYMDEVLKDCIKNMPISLDLNNTASLDILYNPLIKMGKTVEECESRRQSMGISVKYSRAEMEEMLTNTTDTFETQSKTKKGFKRIPFSMTLKVMNAENEIGCRVQDMTKDMIDEYLDKKFVIK